jgi:hypothetical protein
LGGAISDVTGRWDETDAPPAHKREYGRILRFDGGKDKQISGGTEKSLIHDTICGEGEKTSDDRAILNKGVLQSMDTMRDSAGPSGDDPTLRTVKNTKERRRER